MRRRHHGHTKADGCGVFGRKGPDGIHHNPIAGVADAMRQDEYADISFKVRGADVPGIVLTHLGDIDAEFVIGEGAVQ